MTAAALLRCDYCGADLPAGETFQPYAGVVRCRDTADCKQRQVYAGSHTEPPAHAAAAAVSGAGPCAICGASQPSGGVFERSGGVRICLDRPGCDTRSIESQYLTAHGDDGQAEYTSAMMRAVAMASVAQVDGTVPADVTEASQAAASADYAYALAASARRR